MKGEFKKIPQICIQLNPTVFVANSDIGTALQHSQFGSGSGLFHYERLGCRGDENTLSKCRSRTFVTGDCSHGNEAAVVCAPPEGQCDFQSMMDLNISPHTHYYC